MIRRSLELDIYHALGCSWIVGYSNSDGGDYVWPDLRDMGDGALTKINDYLQALVTVVPQLSVNVQGKSIRRGAVNELVRSVPFEAVVRFGNWDNGYCSMMEYYDLMDEERIQCAKRLAGFSKNDRCFPPRLDAYHILFIQLILSSKIVFAMQMRILKQF